MWLCYTLFWAHGRSSTMLIMTRVVYMTIMCNRASCFYTCSITYMYITHSQSQPRGNDSNACSDTHIRTYEFAHSHTHTHTHTLTWCWLISSSDCNTIHVINWYLGLLCLLTVLELEVRLATEEEEKKLLQSRLEEVRESARHEHQQLRTELEKVNTKWILVNVVKIATPEGGLNCCLV